ncbi:2-octaprenyl-3-methyl-6-methoxy-1,4-benzoquinol hydroxylase [Marinobacter halodurans]|uniref:2-octaprenyl-3-methyl-6-methoxy-1,4-benzoquinol hydroxylase n=1 Tax=Marinobacter halodurans TaxID=2528979 RepID=A0ABY1ZR11_9GAMM|nr:FAD-dependent monooxygenase [Marinobacter halodurans]TBW58482.1 2-octaprenyl-3-methyl-6-methoxy-1,4-benzoquinol hydroxylase [Marinobacter halodurans]
MSTPQHFDILVVGGGMTGAAAALGLCRQGWQVGLVETASLEDAVRPLDSAATVDDFEPRVSALSLASQALLQTLGVWEAVTAERHCPYADMAVWDADGTGRIHFEAAAMGVPSLGTIVENRSLVRALMNAVSGASLELFAGVSVSGWTGDAGCHGIQLEDGRRLQADLVVAADGPQSRVRQWAGLPTREWDYDQQGIVCTVETAQPHQATAWQRFSPTGPLAFLPLANEAGSDHFCSIVWSQDTAEARRLMALDDAAFTVELEAAIERQLGAVKAVSRRFAFPLRQRHAKDYVKPGLALIGDAAHTIHPLAGQGVNLGYGDVRVLLEEMARLRESGLPAGEPSALARYQRRRKGENLAMMAAMEGFKQLFARDELPLRWIRNAGMRWLDGRDGIKNRLAAQAMGIEAV